MLFITKSHPSKGTGKVHLYSITTDTYATSEVLSSQTEPANSLGCSPSPCSRTLTCNYTAICSPSLPFSAVQQHGHKYKTRKKRTKNHTIKKTIIQFKKTLH